MKTEQNNEVLDEFHYHEIIDRLHIIINTVEDHLLSHPVCCESSDVKTLIEERQAKLIKAYQRVGKAEFDAFDSENNTHNNG